ncbi:antitoxin [Paraburkholderia heleia]|uniref:antitoxin n=1 Tax=Paraburkholderia heleia TaxID=634127 RepID=UPI000A0388C3
MPRYRKPSGLLLRPPSTRPREAKLFRNNRSQAVRIPVEFELPGDRVLIYREGDRLLIEPVRTPSNIIELPGTWRHCPAIAIFFGNAWEHVGTHG